MPLRQVQEDPLPYSNKADLAALDEELNRHEIDSNDLSDLTIEGEDVSDESDDDVYYGAEQDDADDDYTFGGDYDNE